MEYTYQPASAARGSRLFSRSAATTAKKSAKIPSDTDIPVKEVVLGRSLLARFGYWLLMRNARTAKPSHNQLTGRKKPKVTRSELRQNKLPEHILSIASSGGGRKLVRIATGKSTQVSGATGKQKSAVNRSGVRKQRPLRRNRVGEKGKCETLASGLGVSQAKSSTRHSSVPRDNNFEQDQFVKTERNIAAAMKEAKRGISAEQLVIRFGLSVPEAGLITSMYK